MDIDGYRLEYQPKVLRAQGVASEGHALLVEYDRLGGLITKEATDAEGNVVRVKIKNGTFYDFEHKVARAPEDVTVKTEGVVKTKRSKKSKAD